MSRTEPGYQDFEDGADMRDPGIPSELWSLLRTISTQIEEADQRQTGLLQELRDRLAVLSREAEEARRTVPASAAPAYERIESGLADLAQRIDALDDMDAHPVVEGPAVLRSPAGRQVWAGSIRSTLLATMMSRARYGTATTRKHSRAFMKKAMRLWCAPRHARIGQRCRRRWLSWRICL